MSEERLEAIQSLKSLLQQNDGELSYWGKPIVLPEVRTPTAAEALSDLRTHTIGDCQRCPLSASRIKIVFGVGNPQAEVMFVGEGPGFDEDRIGEPFVGKAGQLLDKILAAIDLDRSKVYIANIVKCHPMIDPSDPEKRGNDRPPSPEEIEKCIPFLKKQIEAINPRMIVTLGAVATRALLNRSEGITKLRGKVVHADLVEGRPPIPVLPTYHPAALLRDPLLKKPVWEDMKFLRETLLAPRTAS